MIAKQMEEDRLSNSSSTGGAPGENAEEGVCEPELALDASHGGGHGHGHGASPRDRTRNWGWLLSGTVFLNLVILGTALVSASTFNSALFGSADLQVFLIVIILMTTLWMLYYHVYTSKEEHAVLYKDGHAGPVWLRGTEAYRSTPSMDVCL